MKKIIKQTSIWEYVVEKYDDIYEFMDVIDKRPINRHCRAIGYRHSEIKNDRWYGTPDYPSSVELMSKGYEEGVRMIEEAVVIDHDNERRPTPEVAYCGHRPYMPNVLAGLPKAMVRRVPNEKPGRSIDLYYDVTADCKKSVQEISRASRIVLDTIADIERNGTKVNLYCMTMIADDKHRERICCIIKLKDAQSRLNLLKVSYPMVHPSFLRRQIFRWIESQPDVKYRNTVKAGRCYSISPERERDFLIKAGALTDRDYFMNCEYVCKCIRTASRLKEVIERQTELKKAAI